MIDLGRDLSAIYACIFISRYIQLDLGARYLGSQLPGPSGITSRPLDSGSNGFGQLLPPSRRVGFSYFQRVR